MIPFDHIVVMAKTVWGEARGESRTGKLAVAWVIRNRHDSGRWFGRGTLAEVCMKPYQFSCWLPDDPNSIKLRDLSMDDDGFQHCLHAALTALYGYEADPTFGSTHYYAYNTKKPKWAEGKTPQCRIGNHEFYAGIE